MKYSFVKNGAALKMHDTLEQALLQARQWKAHHLSARVTVEEYHDHDFEKGYVRTYNDVVVEIPMLVPSLTPRHDFDYPPYGSHVVSLRARLVTDLARALALANLVYDIEHDGPQRGPVDLVAIEESELYEGACSELGYDLGALELTDAATDEQKAEYESFRRQMYAAYPEFVRDYVVSLEIKS